MLQPPNYDAYAQVVEDEMVSGQLRMIETAGHFKGLEPFVKRFKAKGAYVIHKCVTIRHAKSAEKVRNYLTQFVSTAEASDGLPGGS